METNNELNLGSWVEERLAKLRPGDEWPLDTSGALARFKAERDRTSPSGGRWLWAAALATASLIAVLAFPAPRLFAQRCVNTCESFFTPAAATAPDFVLKDVSGAEIRLSALKGQVVLLNFWATWCVPCQAEIPWFSEFEQTFSNRGFRVIGVSMDEDGWKSVKPYMESKKIGYQVVLGNDTIARHFGGVDALPETLLIDKHGRVASRHVGLVSKNLYKQEIVELLKSK